VEANFGKIDELSQYAKFYELMCFARDQDLSFPL